MATAEFAVALPALVLVVTVVLSSVSLGLDQVRCVDAARAAVRLMARGESAAAVRAEARAHAPPGSRVSISDGGAVVTVEVVAQTPGLLRRLGITHEPRGVAHARSERSLGEQSAAGGGTP